MTPNYIILIVLFLIPHHQIRVYCSHNWYQSGSLKFYMICSRHGLDLMNFFTINWRCIGDSHMEAWNWVLRIVCCCSHVFWWVFNDSYYATIHQCSSCELLIRLVWFLSNLFVISFCSFWIWSILRIFLDLSPIVIPWSMSLAQSSFQI